MRRVRGADHIQSSLSVVLTDAAHAAPVTHRGSGLKSTTGAYRGASTPMERTKSRRGGLP